MALDREMLKQEIWRVYREEHAALDEGRTLNMLARGRAFDLGSTLAAGGVVVFPHAGVADCGHQIAAAVTACWDSGADQVVVISVLHAFNDEMEAARVAVAADETPNHSIYWGIQGPGIEGPRQEWRHDHALYSFRYFWNAER